MKGIDIQHKARITCEKGKREKEARGGEYRETGFNQPCIILVTLLNNKRLSAWHHRVCYPPLSLAADERRVLASLVIRSWPRSLTDWEEFSPFEDERR